ncbi:hypothetical protein [Streptomyces sp. OE57]|uniref:hypothetical protein n=1 Tax=Streptomyces lacaronensis TaxID=3379885 RepID=UPI0039B75014
MTVDLTAHVARPRRRTTARGRSAAAVRTGRARGPKTAGQPFGHRVAGGVVGAPAGELT